MSPGVWRSTSTRCTRESAPTCATCAASRTGRTPSSRPTWCATTQTNSTSVTTVSTPHTTRATTRVSSGKGITIFNQYQEVNWHKKLISFFVCIYLFWIYSLAQGHFLSQTRYTVKSRLDAVMSHIKFKKCLCRVT